MSDAVVWWTWMDDGACHAFPLTRLSGGGPSIETECGEHAAKWRIVRAPLGAPCSACVALVTGIVRPDEPRGS